MEPEVQASPLGDEGKFDVLTAGAEELTASVVALTESVENLEAKSRTNRRVLSVISVLVVLKLATIVVLIIALVGLSHANDRIKSSLRQNYATAQQQAQTRVKVLCPLYAVLLTSAADPARRGALLPAQQKQFDASVKVIKDGYATLGCSPAIP